MQAPPCIRTAVRAAHAAAGLPLASWRLAQPPLPPPLPTHCQQAGLCTLLILCIFSAPAVWELHSFDPVLANPVLVLVISVLGLLFTVRPRAVAGRQPAQALHRPCAGPAPRGKGGGGQGGRGRAAAGGCKQQLGENCQGWRGHRAHPAPPRRRSTLGCLRSRLGWSWCGGRCWAAVRRWPSHTQVRRVVAAPPGVQAGPASLPARPHARTAAGPAPAHLHRPCPLPQSTASTAAATSPACSRRQ